MTNRKEKKNVELFELKCLYQLDSLVFAVFFASSESTQEELPDGYTLLKKKRWISVFALGSFCCALTEFLSLAQHSSITWLTEWIFRILILHIFRLAKKKRKTEEKTEVQKTPAHRQNKKEQTSAKVRVLLAELEN